MKKIFVSFIVLLFSLPLFAAVNIPVDFAELHGAFKGAGTRSGQVAHLLVYKIYETNPVTNRAEASGRFAVFLLTNNKTRGQIFDGIWLEGDAMGLLSIGKSPNSRYLARKTPPAGRLEKSHDRKHGVVLKLNPQDNSSLQESYVFYRESDDIHISNENPMNFFADKKESVTITNGRSGTLSVELDMRSLDRVGKFVGVFESTGVISLRKEELNNSMQPVGDLEITGVMVSILDGKKQSIVVGDLANDGSPKPVKLLKQSR